MRLERFSYYGVLSKGSPASEACWGWKSGFVRFFLIKSRVGSQAPIYTYRKNALVVVALLAAMAGSSPALQVPTQAPIKDPPLAIPGSSQRSRENLKDAVQFLAPVQITVAADRPALVDLHFQIANGLHINSHVPRQKTLIPTRIAVVEQPGLNVTGVEFPPGAEYALALAPKEKLSVYTGDFTLRAHLRAHAGEHLFQAELRYQACDVNSCMPPQTIPVEIGILAK